MQRVLCLQKLLFSQYPEVGSLLFAHLVRSSGGNGNASHISMSAFRQQAERFLAVLTDDRTVELYLKVFRKKNAKSIIFFYYYLLIHTYP